MSLCSGGHRFTAIFTGIGVDDVGVDELLTMNGLAAITFSNLLMVIWLRGPRDFSEFRCAVRLGQGFDNRFGDESKRLRIRMDGQRYWRFGLW